MKKYSLLVLTSLIVFSSCGGSTPLQVVINPVDGSQIVIHREIVSNFFNSEDYDYVSLPAEINARTDQGDNNPIKLSWNSTSLVSEYKVVLSDEDQTLTYLTNSNSFDFYNYKLHTTYEAHVEVGNYISEPISFTTPSGFSRTIKVEGVSNFRDLGGYGNFKQGLIYRSVTFENNTISGSEYTEITDRGIAELHNLGIKAEIDLRKADEIGDYPVIEGNAKYTGLEGIDYQFKPLHYGGSNIIAYKGTVGDTYYDNPKVIKEVLEYMADQSHYPMVFHCVRGTDRTGCIAYILKGLLGIEEEYILKDFIFSDFYNIGSPVRLENNKYAALFKKEEGATLKEQISNYLINKMEVSEGTINSIIEILKAE